MLQGYLIKKLLWLSSTVKDKKQLPKTFWWSIIQREKIDFCKSISHPSWLISQLLFKSLMCYLLQLRLCHWLKLNITLLERILSFWHQTIRSIRLTTTLSLLVDLTLLTTLYLEVMLQSLIISKKKTASLLQQISRIKSCHPMMQWFPSSRPSISLMVLTLSIWEKSRLFLLVLNRPLKSSPMGLTSSSWESLQRTNLIFSKSTSTTPFCSSLLVASPFQPSWSATTLRSRSARPTSWCFDDY